MNFSPFLFLLFFIFTSLPGQAQIDTLRGEWKDTAHRYLSPFPDKTQIAVGVLEGDEEDFFGLKRDGNSIRTVSNADSVFEIGSLSKVFTASLLAKFVSDGRLDLNGSVWPKLGLKPKVDEPITFQQLATHSSGLPRLPSHPSFSDISDPYKAFDQEDLKNYLEEDLRLIAPPGDSSQYSNLGYGVLDYALSSMDDTSYEGLLQRHIARPLDMKSTTTKKEEVDPYLVQGYNPQGSPASYWNFEAMKGAGAILSSVEDLSRYLRAQFDSSNTAYLLQQKIRRVGKDSVPMGLGWHISEQDQDSPWYWHNGGTGGFRSCVVMNPKSQRAVIVLSNISGLHMQADRIDRLCFSLMGTL